MSSPLDIQTYYADGLKNAGAELSMKAKGSINEAQAKIRSKIEFLQLRLKKLEKNPFKGSDQEINAQLKNRELVRKKIVVKEMALQKEFKYLEGVKSKLEKLTDSVSIRNLVEEMGIKYGQVQFKEKKFAFITYHTNEKVYLRGALSEGLKDFDKSVVGLARSIEDYIDGRKKGIRPNESEILSRKIKALEGYKKVFSDPKKGLEAALKTDQTLKEVDILFEKAKSTFQEVEKELKKLDNPPKTPHIDAEVKVLYKGFANRYKEIEKKYEGNLHYPAIRQNFNKEIDKLKIRFLFKISQHIVQKNKILEIAKKADTRLERHNHRIDTMRKAVERHVENYEKVDGALIQSTTKHLENYRTFIRDLKFPEAERELEKMKGYFPEDHFLNRKIDKKTFKGGLRAHMAYVQRIDNEIEILKNKQAERLVKDKEIRYLKAFVNKLKPLVGYDWGKMDSGDLAQRAVSERNYLAKREAAFVDILERYGVKTTIIDVIKNGLGIPKGFQKLVF